MLLDIGGVTRCLVHDTPSQNPFRFTESKEIRLVEACHRETGVQFFEIHTPFFRILCGMGIAGEPCSA